MKYGFTEGELFAKVRERYFPHDEEYAKFQLLLDHPKRWPVIPGAAPLRKARWGLPAEGSGKSAGLRIIYMLLPEFGRILLLHVYHKSERKDLAPGDAVYLAAWAKGFRESLIRSRRKGRSR